MKTANPYIYFNGNTEEAFTFYKSVFNGEFESIIRFRDFGENPMGISSSISGLVSRISSRICLISSPLDWFDQGLILRR